MSKHEADARIAALESQLQMVKNIAIELLHRCESSYTDRLTSSQPTTDPRLDELRDALGLPPQRVH